MARDYSNRGNNNRSSKSKNSSRQKSRAAGRKAPRKNTRKQSGTPGWVWLASGLCIGLTVAALVYLITRPTSHPGRELAPVEMPHPDSTKEAAAQGQNAAGTGAGKQANAEAEKQSDEPRFAFYEMLQDYEIVIPRESYPENTGDTDSSSSTPEPTEPQPTTPTVQQPGTYIIQAGSFSTREDADRRRAELTLLGMQARVIQHKFDSGRVVYRVRTRTIESNDRLTEMLQRLRAEGIGTLVLRQTN